MKTVFSLLALLLFVSACGTEYENYRQIGYSAQTNPSESDRVTITFQEEHEETWMSLAEEQKAICQRYADTYQKDNKVSVAKDEVKLSVDSPKHICSARALKKCVKKRWIHTLHCEYKITQR